MDKRARSDLFRHRLQQAMALSGETQSSLARKTGADRSTLSQILSGTAARLPNGQLVAQCAQSLGVSADWLLGLSDQPDSLAQILAQAMTMVDAPRALIDAQIFAWHQEAAGYKIRHVPAGLPDMVKIRADAGMGICPQPWTHHRSRDCLCRRATQLDAAGAI